MVYVTAAALFFAACPDDASAAQRADLARDLAAAANTIKSAETAKVEAENARAISAAVNRMATQARQDRAHAEKLLAEVKRRYTVSRTPSPIYD
jgi:uncharacterized protein (DUF3084 family)